MRNQSIYLYGSSWYHQVPFVSVLQDENKPKGFDLDNASSHKMHLYNRIFESNKSNTSKGKHIAKKNQAHKIKMK